VLLGLVLGFIWGARLTREALRLEQRAADERAKAPGPTAPPANAEKAPSPGVGFGATRGAGQLNQAIFEQRTGSRIKGGQGTANADLRHVALELTGHKKLAKYWAPEEPRAMARQRRCRSWVNRYW